MQVLKFGGTSVANAENIGKAVRIVEEELQNDKTIVVASALSGVTNKLIEIGNAAADPFDIRIEGNKEPYRYEVMLNELESQHIGLIDKLLPEEYREGIKETVHNLFKELRGICKGVFRLKELSFHTLDLIMSFGEILSTKIIEIKFASMGISCKWVDSRQLIKTYFAISQNIVDMEQTNDNIKKVLLKGNARLYLLPGFVASDSTGRVTTLGRGGSDYTAALLAVGTGARIQIGRAHV